MTKPALTMPCGCQVLSASSGLGLELKYCGIHAYAPALFIEGLDVIDYFSDDWPAAVKDDSRNLARKSAVINLIKMHPSRAPMHYFSKSEYWPAVDVCTICSRTRDEGNHP